MDDARRCTARSKQSGERCKRAAAIGRTVCKIHGGGAPQVKAKAEERATEARVIKRLERYRQSRTGISPAAGYQDSLDLSAAIADASLELASDKDEELTQAELLVLHKIAADHSRIAIDGVKAGIAERAVALQEAQAAFLGDAMMASMSAAGVPAVQAVQVMELLRAKLDARP